MISPEVWYAIPTASERNCAETLPEWRARGYRIALLQDKSNRFDADADITVAPFDDYRGYGRSINHLIREVIPASAPIVVAGGDDMFPDMAHTAEEIAAQFLQRFPDTFGVMQPIGDAWENTANICGSPWIGREFARRMYGGRGAYCEEYFQLYEDTELHDVAEALGLLWKRPDLMHFHKQWKRERGSAAVPPTYLEKSLARERESAAIYARRKAAGFPGHRPLPVPATPPDRRRPNPIRLSVLIPSIPSRYVRLLRPLLDDLENQTAGRNDTEVLILTDNKARSIGLKRDALVQIARGEFCAFVDDDDRVAPDYVERIVGCIALNPLADVITFRQVSRINDDNPYEVDFGLGHPHESAGRDASGRWRDIKRPPYHVCAWRTELARRHRFPDASYGEDWHWARRVALDATREARIDAVLHYYHYRDSVTEAAHTYPTAVSVA